MFTYESEEPLQGAFGLVLFKTALGGFSLHGLYVTGIEEC